MNPDQQDAPLPARRTLTDLPPELKAIIARMARDQDTAHRARSNYSGALGLLGKGDWDGKSANALALVDRGWHSAVAPLVFETITASRCVESIFAFRIASAYGRFVKNVQFDWTSLADNNDEDWCSLLRALPSFTNLEHVELTEEAVLSLFDTGKDQATMKEAFRNIAPSVSSLCINSEDTDSALFMWILPLFIPRLRRFKWAIHQGDEEEEWVDIVAVIRMVSACRTLEHLVLWCSDERLLAAFNGMEANSTSWPSLRSLELIFDEDMGMESWKLIQSFSATLEVLDITFNAEISDNLLAETDSPSPAFPHLHRLKINADSVTQDISPLLKLFSASPVRHLDVSISPERSSTTLLKSALRTFPTQLQSVRIGSQYIHKLHHLPPLAPTLASLASARNVSITLAPSYDVYLHRPHLVNRNQLPPSDVDDNCDQLGEILQYGLRQAEGLRVSRDGVAVDRLRLALEPLKAHMLRGRD